VTAFLKLVGPFIDPITKTKIRYNEPLTDHVPAAQLMKNAGGECEFEYDHAAYWPALDALATARRKERRGRWEKAGKHIGESEVYLWGGDEPSIGSKAEAVNVDEVANGVGNLDVNGAETKPAETVANGAEVKPAEAKPADAEIKPDEVKPADVEVKPEETKPAEAKEPEKAIEKVDDAKVESKNDGVDAIKPLPLA
jgi:hypothetical protein